MTRHQLKRIPRIAMVALLVAASTVAVAVSVATSSSSAKTAKTASGDPLRALPLFVSKNTQAGDSESAYRRAGKIHDANLMGRIAKEPEAIWLTDSSTIGILKTTFAQAKRQHQMPIYVLYNIPHRDCGSYSSGGASSAGEYETWIRRVAAQLGSSPAAVIIEPDALPEMTCWTAGEQNTAYRLIHYAASKLSARPRTTVYLDAGNKVWQSASTMARRLRRAGIGMVRGFSLNESSFVKTSTSVAYGKQISKDLGGKKHFIVDTSRNGRGPLFQLGSLTWCNPPGRGLGMDPTTHTGSALVDAYMWVKLPGQSDGECNGGPSSGTWWPSYALGLASRAERR